MRALVTGAGGFVGANLVARLLRDGHEVHAVVQPDADDWRLAKLRGVRTHHVDLVAAGTANHLIQELAPDWVFHLAAYGAYSWQTDAPRIIAVNLSATVALAEAAEAGGVSAFINAGSSSEYGFKDHAPDEDERPDPNSAYAVAKVAATMYCRHRAVAGELAAVTLRLYSVYGELEDHRRLVPSLIAHGLQGRLPPLVAPETARDFVYVEDVCDAFLRAAERIQDVRGGVYNIGSGRQLTLRQLVDHVREVMAISAEPRWGSYPQRSWDTNVWYASTARADRELGWSATTEIEEGLRRTITALGDPAIAVARSVEVDHATPSGAVTVRRDGGPRRSQRIARDFELKDKV